MKNQGSVLICDPINQEGINRLKEGGFAVDVNFNISNDELLKVTPNYDVLIVRSRTKVTKNILEAGVRLRLVARAGAGLDNVDLETAERRGIRVLNTPEAPAEAAAELTIGLILSLARNIARADCAMKEGKWTKDRLFGWELKGKTLGLIGLGKIGERVAKFAKAFGANILITKRTPPDPATLNSLKAEFVVLSELLERSDVVTIHVPYTVQTHHLIGEEEFKSMKTGAYLVNTSRGAIVDEKALVEALQSGKLSGAALDVYETEPPADWTLMKLPNVVCTPHIGAQTSEAQRMASILIAEKIINSLPNS